MLSVKKLFFCCITVLFFSSLAANTTINTFIPDNKKTYAFTLDPIDVVIVCHPKDAETLPLAIKHIKQYGNNIRNVYVVSSKKITDTAIWFNEELFPFKKLDIALAIFQGNQEEAFNFINKPKSRIGWIYQQFLKLYAPFVIPTISSNVLILDADTIFLKPTRFMNDKGEPFFTQATEYHIPYFIHGARVIPEFCRIHKDISGIAHHMLFQRPLLEDLLATIKTIHQKEPWKALCECIDPAEFSGMSEYELYFNFALANASNIHMQQLAWKNMSLNQYKQYLAKKEQLPYAYVSCHSYL